MKRGEEDLVAINIVCALLNLLGLDLCGGDYSAVAPLTPLRRHCSTAADNAVTAKILSSEHMTS